jgi:hypothetical protein
VRGIKSADNLVTQVEGDIEDVNRVLKIIRIRLHYRFGGPFGTRENVKRLLASYAEKCPAYQSVKGRIECSWDAFPLKMFQPRSSHPFSRHRIAATRPVAVAKSKNIRCNPSTRRMVLTDTEA